jgi:hypothetical protein
MISGDYQCCEVDQWDSGRVSIMILLFRSTLMELAQTADPVCRSRTEVVITTIYHSAK